LANKARAASTSLVWVAVSVVVGDSEGIARLCDLRRVSTSGWHARFPSVQTH
jgi:hypothetical protein